MPLKLKIHNKEYVSKQSYKQWTSLISSMTIKSVPVNLEAMTIKMVQACMKLLHIN